MCHWLCLRAAATQQKSRDDVESSDAPDFSCREKLIFNMATTGLVVSDLYNPINPFASCRYWVQPTISSYRKWVGTVTRECNIQIVLLIYHLYTVHRTIYCRLHTELIIKQLLTLQSRRKTLSCHELLTGFRSRLQVTQNLGLWMAALSSNIRKYPWQGLWELSRGLQLGIRRSD